MGVIHVDALRVSEWLLGSILLLRCLLLIEFLELPDVFVGVHAVLGIDDRTLIDDLEVMALVNNHLYLLSVDGAGVLRLRDICALRNL